MSDGSSAINQQAHRQRPAAILGKNRSCRSLPINAPELNFAVARLLVSARGLASMTTERPSPRFADIDIWEPADVLEAMIGGQFAAVAAVRAALPAIERAALAMEPRLARGGRLIYAGAGTSGRLAVQD